MPVAERQLRARCNHHPPNYPVGNEEVKIVLRKPFRLLLFLPLVLVAFVGFAVSSYKYEVCAGTFVPLSIGQTKAEVLSILRARGERPFPERPGQFFAGPQGAYDSAAALKRASAVQVNFGYSVIHRAEFEGYRLARFRSSTRGGICPGCRASYRAEREKSLEAMGFFEQEIFVGQTREEYFAQLRAQGVVVAEAARPAIVELEFNQDFWPPRPREDEYFSTSNYEQLLLSNDEWYFYGLRELAWYSWFDTPFNSLVRLHFDDDRLYWIEHYHSPNEMP